MTLTSESKFFVGILGVTVSIIAAAALLISRPSPPSPTVPQETLVASH